MRGRREEGFRKEWREGKREKRRLITHYFPFTDSFPKAQMIKVGLWVDQDSGIQARSPTLVVGIQLFKSSPLTSRVSCLVMNYSGTGVDNQIHIFLCLIYWGKTSTHIISFLKI